MTRWRHMAGLILLLMLAFGMRLYRLADLPPGLFHDEAYNTLDAQALAEGLPHPRFYDSWEVYARIIHPTYDEGEQSGSYTTTRFPVFLEGNYGREPLFHYLGALAVAVVGPRVWTLRLVAAFAGTLAVLSTYLVARELFSGAPERAMRLSLLAAGVVTGIYSLLAFSRMGLRIVTLVTLEGFAMASWWRASRRGRPRQWVMAGVLLGLSQYTYIPARLLPVIVVCPVLVSIVSQPQRRPPLIRGAVLASLVALVVTAPLILFFVRYPAYLTLRAEAIAADAPECGPAVVAANVGRALLGLVWRGDPNPILNLPGRPLLDVVQSIFLVIGLIFAGEEVWRRLESKVPVGLEFIRLPASFLVFWAFLMHTPSFVSGIAPTFGRSIGGLLPVTILVAVGMEAAWSTVVARWPRRRALATLVALVALTFGIALTARDYFVKWAQFPNLPSILHQEMAVVGRYIGELPGETTVYITPSQKYYATLLLAMGERERPNDFYAPAGLLPVGKPGRETVYVVLDDLSIPYRGKRSGIVEDGKTTRDALEAAFPAGRWDTRPSAFMAYHVPPTPDRGRPRYVVPADFAGLIRLVGLDLPFTDLHPGDTLTVRLIWQALTPMDRRYTAFVHLLGPLDAQRSAAAPFTAEGSAAAPSTLWTQDDHEPGFGTYATDRWSPGEVVMDTFHLHIPVDAPPGDYILSTGFYHLETLERLPRDDAAGDTATMATITLVEQAQ